MQFVQQIKRITLLDVQVWLNESLHSDVFQTAIFYNKTVNVLQSMSEHNY